MPLVDAPAMTSSAAPSGTPGAISPGLETLAGALIAWSGTVVPSGSFPLPCSAAVLALVNVKLVVHAPDNSASGTSAEAFCHRVSRA
jgi:hypothetical protein